MTPTPSSYWYLTPTLGPLAISAELAAGHADDWRIYLGSYAEAKAACPAPETTTEAK